MSVIAPSLPRRNMAEGRLGGPEASDVLATAVLILRSVIRFFMVGCGVGLGVGVADG